MGSNNTMKFFGLVKNKVPSTNEIWALTAGVLTNTGWDSEKAANEDDLIKRIMGVNESKQAMLAVPFHGTRTEDFEKLLKEKQKADVFRIRIFLPDLKAFKMNLLLMGVSVGPILPIGGPDNRASRYKLCKLKVSAADFEAA
jgi:hypothetical protein